MTASGAPPPLCTVEAVVHRSIAGVKPLWDEPNLTEGRFHHSGGITAPTPRNARPTQYLCLHPMGPMAELVRHEELRTVAEVRAHLRNVFAVRVRAERILRVGFAEAATCGINPQALVGDRYEPCRRWVDALLAADDPPGGLIVPSAALPGTENLVLFGPRWEMAWLDAPRRGADLPCAPAGMHAESATTLLAVARGYDDPSPHPALAAFLAGTTFRFAQPRAG